MKASVVVLCLAAIGLAGCSSGGSKSSSATTVAVSSSTSSANATTSTSAAGVADGRIPAYLKTIDVAGRSMTYDQIQFLTGAEAKQAWVKDHPEQPDGPDNDYYIKNVNPKLYTVPISANATVTLANLAKNPSQEGSPATVAELADALAKKSADYEGPAFWLTISGGQITKIEEQWVP